MTFVADRLLVPPLVPPRGTKARLFHSSSGPHPRAAQSRQTAGQEEVKMDNQATISELGSIFGKWCDLLEFAEGPHLLDEVGFNALCDQMNQLERDARPIPATSRMTFGAKL